MSSVCVYLCATIDFSGVPPVNADECSDSIVSPPKTEQCCDESMPPSTKKRCMYSGNSKNYVFRRFWQYCE